MPWRLTPAIDVEIVYGPSETWPSEIRRLRPEVVISLDWAGVTASERNDNLQWSNLERLQAVVEAVADAGARRFVGVGSQAEYGPRNSRIREDSPTNPVTVYGAVKLRALDLVETLCGAAGVQWAWARIFSVYGPMDDPRLLLGTLAVLSSSGRTASLSSGTQRWSYLFAADAARALEILATAPGVAGVYNVAHPDAPVLRYSVELYLRYLTRQVAVEFAPPPTRDQSVSHLEADVARLFALGWRPLTSDEDGLRATADWNENRPVADPFAPYRTLPPQPDEGASG